VKRKAAAAREIKMITLTVSAADEFVDTLPLTTKDTRRESDRDTTPLIEKRLETEAACEYSREADASSSLPTSAWHDKRNACDCTSLSLIKEVETVGTSDTENCTLPFTASDPSLKSLNLTINDERIDTDFGIMLLIEPASEIIWICETRNTPLSPTDDR
jgi:hypothetical protein